jgi:hypothetical protein
VIRIEEREYGGWTNCYFLLNGSLELLVLADVDTHLAQGTLRAFVGTFTMTAPTETIP